MLRKRVGVTDEGKLVGLRQLAQPVKELFYAGDFLELLDLPMVAVVGSRKVSPYGTTVTWQLAGALARAGVVVVSGLALGIDAIAHRAALDAGGKTIAVLPRGLDRIYPASHYHLGLDIVAKGGALVTEYQEGLGAPRKYQFIARNRIIAALSRGVLIPEAAAKSGSLHTANFALEQGIDVFAVPGNITNVNSSGTNELIKYGATPVTSVGDILEALGIEQVSPAASYTPGSQTEAAILKLIQAGVRNTTELANKAQLAVSELNQTLTQLELNGVIALSGSGVWRLN